jgi:hypothetical protein
VVIRKLKTRQWLVFLSVAFTLFWVGLHIPIVSAVMLPITFSICLLVSKRSRQWDIGFVIKAMSLVGFVISYYGILYEYDFIGLLPSVQYAITIVCAYCVGYAVRRLDLPLRALNIVWIFLGIISGFVIFSLLSVLQSIDQMGLLFALANRKAITAWGEDLINAPVLGLFVSLGLCLVPILFWGDSGIKKGHFLLIKLVLVAFGASALYVQFYLRNRTPYIAFLTSIFVSLWLRKFYKKQHNARRLWGIMMVVFSLGGLALLSVRLIPDDAFYVAFGRFSEEGLETPRYEIWQQMVRHLFDHPWGERKVDLLGLNYVHNLWLDVAYNAGILPLIYLLVFHLSHILNLWILVRSQLPPVIIGVIVCMGVSFFFGFMGEPVLDASVSYFAVSCMLLGTVHGFAKDIQRPARWDVHTA